MSSADGYVIHISRHPPTGLAPGQDILMLGMSVRKPGEKAGSWRNEADRRPPVLCIASTLLGDLMDLALEAGYRVRVDLAYDKDRPANPTWCNAQGDFARVLTSICESEDLTVYPVSAWAIPDGWLADESVELATRNPANEEIWHNAFSVGAVRFNAFETSCDLMARSETGKHVVSWAKSATLRSPIPVEWLDYPSSFNSSSG